MPRIVLFAFLILFTAPALAQLVTPESNGMSVPQAVATSRAC